jgi:mitotic spindle assembly checkpoint protein MAD2
MQVAVDAGLTEYLNNVLSQLTSWLEAGAVKKLVVVISSVDTGETLERWVFECDTDGEVLATGATREKSQKEIQREIAAIVRQITSSVSFLPLLDCPCTFDLLVYTGADSVVPTAWEESDPKYIANSNQVRLRSFTTSVHKVSATVAYKADDDDDEGY